LFAFGIALVGGRSARSRAHESPREQNRDTMNMAHGPCRAPESTRPHPTPNRRTASRVGRGLSSSHLREKSVGHWPTAFHDKPPHAPQCSTGKYSLPSVPRAATPPNELAACR